MPELELIELSPTAFEQAIANEAKMSLKQKQARARRMRDRVLRGRLSLRVVAGQQYIWMRDLRAYCTEEQIEVPVSVKYLIALHDLARQKARIR